jgi:hypothetical protein
MEERGGWRMNLVKTNSDLLTSFLIHCGFGSDLSGPLKVRHHNILYLKLRTVARSKKEERL